jgi:cation:H+ antiporter
MIGTVAVALTLASLGFDLRVAHFSWISVVLVVIYIIAMRGVFLYEMDQMAEQVDETGESKSALTLRQVVTRYVAWAAVVVAAAVWLPFIGQRMAETMGWGHSFVGTLFIAFATSLPEIVVTIGCVRQGATDLAIGNVLGSNLFNILILAIDDILYTAGPIFAAVDRVNLISAVTGIMMSGVAIVGLLHRPRSRIFGMFGWISAALLALYLINVFILYVSQPA